MAGELLYITPFGHILTAALGQLKGTAGVKGPSVLVRAVGAAEGLALLAATRLWGQQRGPPIASAPRWAACLSVALRVSLTVHGFPHYPGVGPRTETGSKSQHMISVCCRRFVTLVLSLDKRPFQGCTGPVQGLIRRNACPAASERVTCRWKSDIQNVFSCGQHGLSALGVTPGCGARPVPWGGEQLPWEPPTGHWTPGPALSSAVTSKTWLLNLVSCFPRRQNLSSSRANDSQSQPSDGTITARMYCQRVIL